MTRIATPAAALSSRSPLGTTGTVQHDARPDQRLFRWTLIFSALMSYVPDELHWSNVAFTTTFALLFAWNLLTPPAGLLRVPTTKYLLCFFLAVGISFPNAVLQGVQASEWLRGAIPFFFLVAHLFVGPQDEAEDGEYLINSLQIAATAWAIKICLLAGSELGAVINGNVGRLTYIVRDTLIPYGLLGFVLALFNPSAAAKRWQWPSVAGFLFIIVLCGYRSQLLICGFTFLLYLARANAVNALRRTMLCLLLLPLIGSVVSPDFSDSIRQRFSQALDTGSESRRLLEIEFALESLMDNWVFGNGLGAPVPVAAIDPTFDIEWLEDDSVNYIHNVWFYFLMDLGLPGFVFFTLFAIRPLRSGWNSRDATDALSRLRVCSSIALLALLTYTSCQAAFRGIQFNLMIAVLAAVAVRPAPLARGSSPA